MCGINYPGLRAELIGCGLFPIPTATPKFGGSRIASTLQALLAGWGGIGIGSTLTVNAHYEHQTPGS